MILRCLITLMLLFAILAALQACRGGAEEEYVHDYDLDKDADSIEQDDDWFNKSGLKDRDSLVNNLWHHGWTPSPDEIQQWQDWFEDYKTEFNHSVIDIIDPDNPHEFDEERGPGSGWPIRWADAGVGFGGAAPPPWAYAPRNTGKPRFCYFPPKMGVCYPPDGVNASDFTPPAPIERFGYHPYKDECVAFNFSGCGGNRNNFYTKLKCEESCVIPVPFNGCDIESHIYVDEAIASK